ncbi:MAG TPA: DUF3179 domain-containing (seleno)protein, partial [Blastocatellia bacterium]|nr:DUF3179 domain-containing (seleno)protein [Blastocatellia bacterium]
MTARALQIGALRTDFLDSVDTGKVFKVARNVFPLAIDPPAVPASQATFMRPGDWVVGVCLGDSARAYPAWIMDNYHAVNDFLGGSHIAVMHCEICCSNAVYVPKLNGRRLIFGTAGLYGGTLAVYDVETGSMWSHGMGVAFDGPLKGASLDRIQSFQASWEEWLSFYPKSTVISWEGPAVHPDGRHGHGSRDTFAHAGMYVEPVSTMITGNDNRLAEHEMILTVSSAHGSVAVPLREISRAGGVIQFRLGTADLVSIGASPSSAFVGTYRRHVTDDVSRTLDFTTEDGRVLDLQTGSCWRADGVACSGPLEGKSLQPFPTMINKWHSLACFLPGIPLIEHLGESAKAPLLELEDAVKAICDFGYAVTVDHELYSLELPNGALRGFQVRINNDPFQLFRFANPSVAQDYASCRTHAALGGSLILESSPARRFKDDLNVHRLPDDEVEWSALVGQDRFKNAIEAAARPLRQSGLDAGPNIAALGRQLAGSPYSMIIESECPRDAIPAGAVFGVECSICGDHFLIYRFDSAEGASSYAEQAQHCIATGSFVLRSDPDIYVIPRPLSTIRKPD